MLAYLRDRELLLVLDNFEHLLTGSDFILELLQQTSRMAILATSRRPFRAAGPASGRALSKRPPRLCSASAALSVQTAANDTTKPRSTTGKPWRSR